MKRAAIFILLASTAHAGETYKWTDQEGNLHYTQTPPPAGAELEKTLSYDEEADTRRQMRDIAVQRTMEAETRRRVYGDAQPVASPSQAYEPEPPQAPQRQAPTLSAGDERQLKQIQRDIERLSSSGIGDPVSRQNQIQALQRQQEMIYGKIGVQGSPQVIINRGRPGNY